jgi:signal transduction histidine kinase
VLFRSIEVSDNGRGFAVDAPREGGNGLRNMAARMDEIGGQFMVRSAPVTGTVVCLRLPLPDLESGSSSQGGPIRMGDGGHGHSS